MPEGDTIHYAANRIRPILEGKVPDEVLTPHPRFRMDRWPERLEGSAVSSVDAHGKHLFLRFEGGLTIHSHLRMTGSWGTYLKGERWRRSPRRAWLVLREGNGEVVQFDGPVLDLMTESRTRFDRRITALGPDIIKPDFDEDEVVRRLRHDDPRGRSATPCSTSARSRGSGTCGRSRAAGWLRSTRGGAPPTSPTRRCSASCAGSGRSCSSPRATAPRIASRSSTRGDRTCPRCGTRIQQRGQWDDNRPTYWCEGCQR